MPIPDQPGKDKTQTAYASECSRNPTRRLAGVPACSKSFLGESSDALARGEEVDLHGFGKFKPKERAARQGRNPQTGEIITIAASKGVGFAAAKALKDRLV